MTAQRTAPIALDSTTLCVPRVSASQPGTTHRCHIDLITGVWECGETCRQRNNPNHVHARELLALREAIVAFRATTGLPLATIVRALNHTMTVQAGMGHDWLQHQCGVHPEDERPWAAPDTLAHQAAKLTLADRAALAEAATKNERRVA